MMKGHGLLVRPFATVSNRTGIGTLVRVAAGGKQLMRQVQGSSSAHSEDEVLLHFGLGDASVADHVQVLWPSGVVTDLYDQPADTELVVVEDGLGNQTPIVAITRPIESTAVALGTPVTFAALARDAEDGDVASGLSWRSDRDGPIGNGGSVSTATLSEGMHLVTAEVTDGGGATGTFTTTLIVGNAAPLVRISSPLASTVYRQGSSVPLMATAYDVEDGDLASALAWTSDRDGSLGSGGSLSVTTLSAGTHLVTATVTDSAGAPAVATVEVVVESATTVFVPGTKLLVKQKKSGGHVLSLLAEGPASPTWMARVALRER